MLQRFLTPLPGRVPLHSDYGRKAAGLPHKDADLGVRARVCTRVHEDVHARGTAVHWALCYWALFNGVLNTVKWILGIYAKDRMIRFSSKIYWLNIINYTNGLISHIWIPGINLIFFMYIRLYLFPFYLKISQLLINTEPLSDFSVNANSLH